MKSLAIVMAGTLLLSLAACNNSADKTGSGERTVFF